MGMAELPETKDNKKNSAWFILKRILRFILPWVELIKMNLIINRIRRFYKNDFLDSQYKRNWVVATVLSVFTYFPLIVLSIAIRGDKSFIFRFNRLLLEAKSINLSNSIKIINIILSDKAFLVLLRGSLFSFAISLILSNLIVSFFHSIITDTNKFKKLLIKEGIIKDMSSDVLFTPVGAFLDISGSSAKEIQNNERLWLAMNIEIKGHSFNPDKISELFFKSAFKLKSVYNYDFRGGKIK